MQLLSTAYDWTASTVIVQPGGYRQDGKPIILHEGQTVILLDGVHIKVADEQGKPSLSWRRIGDFGLSGIFCAVDAANITIVGSPEATLDGYVPNPNGKKVFPRIAEFVRCDDLKVTGGLTFTNTAAHTLSDPGPYPEDHYSILEMRVATPVGLQTRDCLNTTVDLTTRHCQTRFSTNAESGNRGIGVKGKIIAYDCPQQAVSIVNSSNDGGPIDAVIEYEGYNVDDWGIYCGYDHPDGDHPLRIERLHVDMIHENPAWLGDHVGALQNSGGLLVRANNSPIGDLKVRLKQSDSGPVNNRTIGIRIEDRSGGGRIEKLDLKDIEIKDIRKIAILFDGIDYIESGRVADNLFKGQITNFPRIDPFNVRIENNDRE